MNRSVVCVVLVVCVLVTGCLATVPVNPYERPTLVDPYRTDMVAYQRDYGQCASLANQTDAQAAANSGAVGGAVLGVLFGAAVGAIIGAAFHDAGSGAAFGAALGGVEGAAGGAAGSYGAARADQEGSLRACLRGRGYNLIR